MTDSLVIMGPTLKETIVFQDKIACGAETCEMWLLHYKKQTGNDDWQRELDTNKCHDLVCKQ